MRTGVFVVIENASAGIFHVTRRIFLMNGFRLFYVIYNQFFIIQQVRNLFRFAIGDEAIPGKLFTQIAAILFCKFLIIIGPSVVFLRLLLCTCLVGNGFCGIRFRLLGILLCLFLWLQALLVAQGLQAQIVQ